MYGDAIAGDPAVSVGVVGDDPLAGRLAAPIEDAGRSVVTGEAGAVCAAGPEFVVTVGEPALLSVARERPSVPVLPIDAGAGVAAVSPDEALGAVAGALAGDARSIEHPLLTVLAGGDPVGTALMDVMLVTSEPARISEYALSYRGERLAHVRADGVVAATGAGSHGYAAAVGGPKIAPETGVVGVVPIAPFQIESERWVLDPAATALSVARDEGTVSLFLDDSRRCTVGPGTTVAFDVESTLEVLQVPEGGPGPNG